MTSAGGRWHPSQRVPFSSEAEFQRALREASGADSSCAGEPKRARPMTSPTVTRTETSITITIPVRPLGKEVTGVAANGVRFTETETKDYMALIRDVARASLPPEPWTGPLEGTIWAFFEPPASWSAKKREAALRDELRPDVSPDCDNISKAVWDALQVTRRHIRALMANDGQITDLIVRKRYADRDAIMITVTRLDLGRGLPPSQPRLF